MGMKVLNSNSCNKVNTSPEKRNVLPRSAGSPRAPNMPQMGLRVGSPRRGDLSPRTGSVLHKAALFESSPTKNSKDPAELSVAERLAMFERNKGQALIPKAAFSMPVPTKYLGGGKDGEKNMPNKVCSPGKGSRMTKNTGAHVQRSRTSNVDSNSVLPPRKGSGHVSNQANKSCVGDVASVLSATSEGIEQYVDVVQWIMHS
jgi:actin-binding protein anillin